MTWQPADSAPLNVEVLAHYAGGNIVVSWKENDNCWLTGGSVDNGEIAPTHWMPLPRPPGARDAKPTGLDFLDAAREAFLDLIAHAISFEEDPDGDMVGGRLVNLTTYKFIVSHQSLHELCDALGIAIGYNESAGQAITRYIEMAKAQTSP